MGAVERALDTLQQKDADRIAQLTELKARLATVNAQLAELTDSQIAATSPR